MFKLCTGDFHQTLGVFRPFGHTDPQRRLVDLCKTIKEHFLVYQKPYHTFCLNSIQMSSTKSQWTIMILRHIVNVIKPTLHNDKENHFDNTTNRFTDFLENRRLRFPLRVTS